MHRPHSITWTTHTEGSTTLLEATRLQEALLYTALHLYVQHCNRILLVQYSIHIFNK